MKPKCYQRKAVTNKKWNTAVDIVKNLFDDVKSLLNDMRWDDSRVCCSRPSVCEVVPETCPLELTEALVETPCCPPRTRRRAACCWSLTPSTAMLPGQTLCTPAAPKGVKVIFSPVWNVYSLSPCCDIDLWPSYRGPTAGRIDSRSPGASAQPPPGSQRKRPPL